jgi:hypothetical protein
MGFKAGSDDDYGSRVDKIHKKRPLIQNRNSITQAQKQTAAQKLARVRSRLAGRPERQAAYQKKANLKASGGYSDLDPLPTTKSKVNPKDLVRNDPDPITNKSYRSPEKQDQFSRVKNKLQTRGLRRYWYDRKNNRNLNNGGYGKTKPGEDTLKNPLGKNKPSDTDSGLLPPVKKRKRDDMGVEYQESLNIIGRKLLEHFKNL